MTYITMYQSESFIILAIAYIQRILCMNKILQEKEIVTTGIFTLLLFIIPMIPTSIADSINPGVFPVNSKPYGLTYSEWSAKWWRWALEIPSSRSPLTDNTGVNCAQNQSGPVWNLAGSTGAPNSRNCTVPAGKALLFSALTTECSYAEDATLKTEAQLRSCAVNGDLGGMPHVVVDGVTLQSLQTYEIQSPLFSFTFPPNNIFGAPAGPSQAVAHGWFTMLKPLSPGKHTVHLSGTVLPNPGSGVGGYASDASYNLDVK
jgi:hypothetical protein